MILHDIRDALKSKGPFVFASKLAEHHLTPYSGDDRIGAYYVFTDGKPGGLVIKDDKLVLYTDELFKPHLIFVLNSGSNDVEVMIDWGYNDYRWLPTKDTEEMLRNQLNMLQEITQWETNMAL